MSPEGPTGGGVVLVGGEALYDLVVDADGTVEALPGGGPFNTARTIARLQRPVSFLSRISGDRFGTTLERMLRDDGVRTDALVRTDDPTTLALAEVDDAGNAKYHFYDRGTSAPGLTPEAALAALPANVAILHIGTLGLTLQPVADALETVVGALGASALIAVDPNVRPWAVPDADRYRARLERVLRRSDVVKVSEEDVAWLDAGRPAEEAAGALLALGPKLVLLTRGADGVTVIGAAGATTVQAPRVDVVDTIGAGDAFTGGFLAWWHARGLDRAALADTASAVEAARFGALVAARTCERSGALPPHLDEVR